MKNRIFQVLAIRSFLFLWLAEAFSQIAMNMVNFVLIIIAFGLAKSSTAVSGIVLSFTIPAIIFGVLAGAYVDRWNKKSVLFWTNALRVLILLMLVFIHDNLWVIYVLSFGFSIVTQFFIPAETPMIPLVVPGNLLLSANALFGLGVYGSALVAYALSGAFLIFFGKSDIFIILAFFFLIASFFVTFIQIPKKLESKVQSDEKIKMHIVKEIKIVLSLALKTRKILHALFLLSLSQILILLLAVIGPGYAISILKIPVDKFPLFFATPAALGMVIGAVCIATFFHNASKHKSITIGVFLSGIAILLFPYGSQVDSRDFIHTINVFLPHIFRITILHGMIVLAFILGIANSLVFVGSNTILQEETSDTFRGKVYGALNAMVGIFSLLPIIAAGAVADVYGVSKVLTGIGVCIIGLGAARLLFLKGDN